MTRLRRLAVDLPLALKLMVPILVLLLSVAMLGTFVLGRDQATRARTSLGSDLQLAALDARSVALDRERYLTESGDFSANLQGMAEAARSGDRGTAAHLLQSVMALKKDLLLVALTDVSGRAIAQYSRTAAGGPITADAAGPGPGPPPLPAAMASSRPAAALGGFSGREALMLATPVCASAGDCAAAGFTLVGIDARSIVPRSQGERAGSSFAIYDDRGLLAVASGAAPPTIGRDDTTSSSRLVGADGRSSLATLFTPYLLQGRRAGTLATTLPTAAAFTSVKAATGQLVLILLAAIVGTVAVVGAISAYLLRRLSQLLDTNRALESGDLSARAQVVGADELGQLARGVNAMASSLQDSHENLEVRVEHRTVEVRRLLQERTEFFAAVSHELRTPLAVIQAHADMLAAVDFEKSQAWQVRAGESIGAATGQLLAFVNDILDLSRAETGGLDLVREPVRVEDLVRLVQPAAETLASTSGVAVSFAAPRDLPPIMGDPRRLRQVFINLLDNAVKYTPRGGTVELVASVLGTEVQVLVVDSGVGIPAEVMGRIFEPFYRVPSTQPQNGQPSSGVGLALVQRIVDGHGGRVAVESVVGGGTTFTVSLPAAPVPEPTPAAKPRGRGTRPKQPKPTAG